MGSIIVKVILKMLTENYFFVSSKCNSCIAISITFDPGPKIADIPKLFKNSWSALGIIPPITTIISFDLYLFNSINNSLIRVLCPPAKDEIPIICTALMAFTLV